jgi:hypothetical protein
LRSVRVHPPALCFTSLARCNVVFQAPTADATPPEVNIVKAVVDTATPPAAPAASSAADGPEGAPASASITAESATAGDSGTEPVAAADAALAACKAGTQRLVCECMQFNDDCEVCRSVQASGGQQAVARATAPAAAAVAVPATETVKPVKASKKRGRSLQDAEPTDSNESLVVTIVNTAAQADVRCTFVMSHVALNGLSP